MSSDNVFQWKWEESGAKSADHGGVGASGKPFQWNWDDTPATPAAASPNAKSGGSKPAGANKPAGVNKPAAAAKPAGAKPAGAKPGAPKPGGPKPGKPGAPRPAAPVYHPAAIAAAEAFGEVGPEGEVYVLEEGAKRKVGTAISPNMPTSEALAIFVQRFLALDGKVKLLESRLIDSDMSPREADKALAKLEKELEEPSAVGDIAALRDAVATLRQRAKDRRAEQEAERAAAKAAATTERTALVEKAESLVAGDTSKIQWKTTSEELRTLLEQWKEAQRSPIRIDRGIEDDLWKRFSAARTTFDRARRQYFAELDENNATIKAKKEAIVKDAEKLSTNTDWGATSSAYRELMAKWKAAGRAGRKDDDALWAQFRAAQDKFFAARDAANKATDAESEANLEVKKAILVDAEAILPVKNIDAAKAALRGIQDRWEAAGKVPRNAMGSVESRMRAVEDAVRNAEQAQWKRTNPETKARAEGFQSLVLKKIEELERDLAKAQASGNAKKVAELEKSLTAQRAWLEQANRAAADHA